MGVKLYEGSPVSQAVTLQVLFCCSRYLYSFFNLLAYYECDHKI